MHQSKALQTYPDAFQINGFPDEFPPHRHVIHEVLDGDSGPNAWSVGLGNIDRFLLPISEKLGESLS